MGVAPSSLMLLAPALLVSCTSGEPTGSGSPEDGLPEDCDITLHPGSDDQTAVQTVFIEASPGAKLCLGKGTFSFTSELSIATSGITLRGAGQGETILDFTNQTFGANGLNITGDSVTVEALQVKNTPGDGIRGSAVKDIHFKDVRVVWDAEASVENGAYGLYPVSCTGVRIEGCTVKGARDAGIYVGQSTKILVADSEAMGNVAGIEIENSTDAEVRDNYAHDNTGGILVFNLPNLPVQDGRRAKVHHNRIENNNLANFASPGTSVSKVSPGCGVVILASDENEIHENTIKDNKSVGVLILSYSKVAFGTFEDPNFDPFPQENWIHDNDFAQNGTEADASIKVLAPVNPVPDIVWDGCVDPMASPSDAASTICLSSNGEGTYMNGDLCGDAGGQSQDISKVTCEHTPLSAQDP